MSATNIVETIKRRLGVLAGAAIGLLLGILILYACDNEKVSSGTKDCAAKPSCGIYAKDSCPSTANRVARVPKKCVSDENSNTNCSSETINCWGSIPCVVKMVGHKLRCVESGQVSSANFEQAYYNDPCPEDSSGDSSS